MASMIYTLYKNDGSGISEEFNFEPGSTFPDAAIIFNETALKFLKWNDSDDGTSTSYFIGDIIPDMGDYYAIWETPDPVSYLVTDQQLKSIADAIRTKGGTSAQLQFPTGFVSAVEAISTGITPTGTKQISITQNGTTTEDVTNYASAEISVNVSGAKRSSDVNFYDYDGTIVASYTASEFAALTALPSNPSHSGLTAQGWNWSLSDAKAHVALYGKLNIGQMYITDDGKTRIYIHLEDGRLSPMLGICPNGTVTVDWGDGTETVTLTGTSTSTIVWSNKHDYAAAGDYVITLAVTGSMNIIGSNTAVTGSCLLRYSPDASNINYGYRNAIRRIELGNNVTIGTYAFGYCLSLMSITIPSSITIIETYAFQYCYSLVSITIPYDVREIKSRTFYYCNSLVSVMIPRYTYQIYGRAFSYCYSLTSIILPDTVSLSDAYIFDYCYSLSAIYGTVDKSNIIPAYTFRFCQSLVTIPDLDVRSIEQNAFNTCHSLTSITIGNSASTQSIGAYAFSGCYSLGFIKFKSSTPPTVSNSNAWNNLPTDCKIYVPAGSLEAYTTATNYPSSSTYTYVEY